MTGFYNIQLILEYKPGYSYSISGWVKGESISPYTMAGFQIIFAKSKSGMPIFFRNKDYLEYMVNLYTDFGRVHDVPMNIGEFGLYNKCFENNKGGLLWVSDALDIFNRYNLNYTYWCYHESYYGIFYNDIGLPDPNRCNNELLDLLSNYFRR